MVRLEGYLWGRVVVVVVVVVVVIGTVSPDRSLVGSVSWSYTTIWMVILMVLRVSDMAMRMMSLLVALCRPLLYLLHSHSPRGRPKDK